MRLLLIIKEQEQKKSLTDPENYVNVYIQFAWKQPDLNPTRIFGTVQSKYHVYILLSMCGI